MRIRGRCHCGNVAFALTWEPDPAEIPARACTCTFCARHGNVWTSDPDAALEITVEDPGLVSRYEFGTRTAQFHVCARCGVVPVVTSRIDGNVYAVVNVNAFDGVDPSLLRRSTSDVEGEGKDPRLARRKRTWIARVTSVQGGSPAPGSRARDVAPARAAQLCDRFGIDVPILLAPMAGACPPSLSIAVANAGGMGAGGMLLHTPAGIAAWMGEFRAASRGPVQLNLWVPDPPPVRDAEREARVRALLNDWGPPVPPQAGDATPPDFGAQCEAVLAAAPTAASSVMGLFPAPFVAALKARGIAWFATVTTVAEAVAAEAAGADVVVAQGAEAGGHRGAFDAAAAERQLVGTFALVPAVVDAVRVPVVAAGGIADGRGVAAALALGASAVQVGTAFLPCPEAKVHPAWSAVLATARPEDTLVSRVFSGRAGRSIATRYAIAASAATAPPPAPYPVQRGLTTAMREEAQRTGDVNRMQAWAGQSAALARAEPAAAVVRRLWDDARALMS